MKKYLPYPQMKNIVILQILKCLSSPIRFEIVTKLFNTGKDVPCFTFQYLGKKSNLSLHYKNLCENGLIIIKREGRNTFVELRQNELQERFPNLLESLVQISKNAKD
ncbi:MAG: helix-turn-helix transcriptional regulator [Lentilactobacillus hilgardii]|uniref:ArsR/SmtB family transcription factor n=1 Tax=Lactobacillaceae TaxID=33958 RepID=UPI0010B66DD1|nr:hypothetical protein OAL24_01633 [Oenococcus sicerae]